MIKSDYTNWFILYTTPRSEKQVKERLETQTQVESWLPLHRSPRVWSDRVKIIEKPLFSSYIFVRCKEKELHQLLSVYGVSHIVYYNGHPAIIKQYEINAIHDFLERAANRPLMPGEEVEILCGAMKHISGRVKVIKKKFLILYLKELGATVCVNTENVARVNRL